MLQLWHGILEVLDRVSFILFILCGLGWGDCARAKKGPEKVIILCVCRVRGESVRRNGKAF